jgi:hypothetical protein
MIVRASGRDLLVITQPDHAALSADLLQRFALVDFTGSPTREAVLLATRHHDIGWEDVDSRPRVNTATGAPYDFLTLPPDVRQGLWPRAVARLAPTSSYVAALVAQHAVTVYGRYRGDRAWIGFLRDMEALRDRWFGADGLAGFVSTPIDPLPPARLRFLKDYGYVGTADLLSLIFCAGWDDTYEVDVFRMHLDATRLVVSPDPFGGVPIPFRVRARRLSSGTFATDEELQARLAAAPDEWLEGTALGRD